MNPSKKLQLPALIVILFLGLLSFLNVATSTPPQLHNPTLEEVKTFLRYDTVHLHPYGIDNYTCWMFAADLQREALKDHIECGITYVIFDMCEVASWGHFVDAFPLTTGEIIYVEPQTACIISLSVGSNYLGNKILDISLVW